MENTVLIELKCYLYKKDIIYDNVRCDSHWGGSLQNGLGDE